MTGSFGAYVVAVSVLLAGAADAPPARLSRVGEEPLASVYEPLVFHAEAGEPIAVGEIADVRLARLGRDQAVLALVSHWQSSDTRLVDATAEVDALRLHLRDPRWRRKQAHDEPRKLERRIVKWRVVDLHFAALLSPGESYRLSWTCRPVGKEPVVAHCDFSTLSIMREGEHLDLSQTPVSTTHTYMCEILLRDNDGNLFLGRSILPHQAQQWSRIPLLSFNAAGKVIDPPSNHEPLRRLRDNITELGPPGRPLPPLVEATGYAGVSLQRDSTRFVVSGSCEGTYGSLPLTERDVAYAFFGDTICRMQRWNDNVMSFREDKTLWRTRTAELHAEIVRYVTSDEPALTRDDPLCCAAMVLRDPVLIRHVETRVRRWAEKEPARDGPWLPRDALGALAVVGDETSVQALCELQAKQPTTAYGLEYYGWSLAQRVGWPATREFFQARLSSEAQQPQTSVLEILRKIDPAIPARTWGDDSLVAMLHSLKLPPQEFFMVQSAEHLQAFTNGRLTLISASERRLLAHPASRQGQWIFPSTAARREGMEKLMTHMEAALSQRNR